MRATLKAFVADESGAAAIEYGIIAALVSVAGVAALTLMGDSLQTLFGRVSSHMSGAAGT